MILSRIELDAIEVGQIVIFNKSSNRRVVVVKTNIESGKEQDNFTKSLFTVNAPFLYEFWHIQKVVEVNSLFTIDRSPFLPLEEMIYDIDLVVS